MGSLLHRFLNIKTEAEKSPAIEGVYQGVKAAVLAAPVAAGIQALRGRNAYLGALVGGLGAGALAGAVTAARQKYTNMQTEANLGYHIQNMADYNQQQEEIPQSIYQPTDISSNFSRGFESVRNPYS